MATDERDTNAQGGTKDERCRNCGKRIYFSADSRWTTIGTDRIMCPYFGKQHIPGKPRTTLAKETIQQEKDVAK